MVRIAFCLFAGYKRILSLFALVTIASCGAQPVTPNGSIEPSAIPTTAPNEGTDASRPQSAPVDVPCMEAARRYVQAFPANVTPELTAGMHGAVLNRGSYLRPCGVPNSMEVRVCTAVLQGRVVGLDVSTVPADPSIASCVAAQIRNLSFPSDRRLDVSRTTFEAVPNSTPVVPSANAPNDPLAAPKQ